MNGIKERAAKGDTLFGTMISRGSSANVVRIIKAAGYNFAILDCEHGYFDFSQIASIAAVGKGVGISVIVRIPSIERVYYKGSGYGLQQHFSADGQHSGDCIPGCKLRKIRAACETGNFYHQAA